MRNHEDYKKRALELHAVDSPYAFSTLLRAYEEIKLQHDHLSAHHTKQWDEIQQLKREHHAEIADLQQKITKLQEVRDIKSKRIEDLNLFIAQL